MQRIHRFVAGWAALYAYVDEAQDSARHFRQLIETFERDLAALRGEMIMLTNKLPLYRQIAELLYNAAVSLPDTNSHVTPTTNTRVGAMTISAAR